MDHRQRSVLTHSSPYFLHQLSFIMVKDERKLHPHGQRLEYSKALKGTVETLEIIAQEFAL